MRFSEAVELKKLRSNLGDLLDYTYGWEQFDPICPQEEEIKVNFIKQDISILLEQLEDKMNNLGKINRDCFEY